MDLDSQLDLLKSAYKQDRDFSRKVDGVGLFRKTSKTGDFIRLDSGIYVPNNFQVPENYFMISMSDPEKLEGLISLFSFSQESLLPFLVKGDLDHIKDTNVEYGLILPSNDDFFSNGRDFSNRYVQSGRYQRLDDSNIPSDVLGYSFQQRIKPENIK